MSLSVAVNVDFRGYLQVLHWHYSTLLKTFQMINSSFTVEITDLHSATKRMSGGWGGGLCSKFRNVHTDVDPCRGVIKK